MARPEPCRMTGAATGLTALEGFVVAGCVFLTRIVRDYREKFLAPVAASAGAQCPTLPGAGSCQRLQVRSVTGLAACYGAGQVTP